MAKLADVTESISFLEEQLKSIKERILEVEEDMEQLIAASTSLYTNYLLLRSIKGIGIINAIVLLCVTDNFQRSDLTTRGNLPAIVGSPHLNILQVFPYGEKRRLLHWLTKK